MTDRRMLLIVNPRGGRRRGLTVLERVEPVLRAADMELEVHLTEGRGHARQIARESSLEGCDRLCLIGGDGTVHETVSGLLDRDGPTSTPVGIIPGGTGNDVARHLGIDDPLDAARRILAGRTAPFDVVRITAGDLTDYCVTLVGWAGVADINCRAERLRVLGPSRYAVASLWQILFPKRRSAELVLDDRSLEGDFLLVVACNTIFAGSGMRLAPRARVDDGMVDVVILRDASRWQMLRLFTRVFKGTHVDLPGIEYYQVRSLRILADDREPLDIDGEIRGTTPASIDVIPGAIRMFV